MSGKSRGALLHSNTHTSKPTTVIIEDKIRILPFYVSYSRYSTTILYYTSTYLQYRIYILLSTKMTFRRIITCTSLSLLLHHIITLVDGKFVFDDDLTLFWVDWGFGNFGIYTVYSWMTWSLFQWYLWMRLGSINIIYIISSNIFYLLYQWLTYNFVFIY